MNDYAFSQIKYFISEFLKESNENYQNAHRAPGPGRGAPLWNLTDNHVYPDDVYSSLGPRYYGIGDGSDTMAWSLIKKFKNKPEALITIFRAVPRDLKDVKINPGDWVTIDKNYAISHGQSRFDEEYKILTMKVIASSLYTDGNSILEWGYYP